MEDQMASQYLSVPVQWINIQTCLAVIVIQSFYSIVNALRGCI